MAQSTTEKARDTVQRLKPGERELTPAAKTIAAVATAALAGGLAAALKALVEHRSSDEDDRQEDDENGEPTEGSAREQDAEDGHDGEQEEQEQDDAPQASGRDDGAEDADDGDQEEEQDAAAAPQASGRNDEDENVEEEEPKAARQEGNGNGRRHQTSDGNAARIVEAGKSELEALLGQQVESVSGFSRSDDGWCVTYEVVEMRRIPDSSDVLSSYAVVLDGDGGLMTLERKQRYRRAQVDEG